MLISAAAKRCELSVASLKRKIAEGILTAEKQGSRWLVSETEIAKFLAVHGKAPPVKTDQKSIDERLVNHLERENDWLKRQLEDALERNKKMGEDLSSLASEMKALLTVGSDKSKPSRWIDRVLKG
jgi:hypothetical protein